MDLHWDAPECYRPGAAVERRLRCHGIAHAFRYRRPVTGSVDLGRRTDVDRGTRYQRRRGENLRGAGRARCRRLQRERGGRLDAGFGLVKLRWPELDEAGPARFPGEPGLDRGQQLRYRRDGGDRARYGEGPVWELPDRVLDRRPALDG